MGLSAALAPSSARCAAAILCPENARRPQTPRREFRRRALTSRAGPCRAPRRPRDNLPPTGPRGPWVRSGEAGRARRRLSLCVGRWLLFLFAWVGLPLGGSGSGKVGKRFCFLRHSYCSCPPVSREPSVCRSLCLFLRWEGKEGLSRIVQAASEMFGRGPPFISSATSQLQPSHKGHRVHLVSAFRDFFSLPLGNLPLSPHLCLFPLERLLKL